MTRHALAQIKLPQSPALVSCHLTRTKQPLLLLAILAGLNQPVLAAGQLAQWHNEHQQLQLALFDSGLVQFAYGPAANKLSLVRLNSPMLLDQSLRYNQLQAVASLPNIEVDAKNLCFRLMSPPTATSKAEALVELCPSLKTQGSQLQVRFNRPLIDVLGLGQRFDATPKGSPATEGSQIEDSASLLNMELPATASEFGNSQIKYFSGKGELTQIPVAYFMAESNPSWGLLVDVPSKQNWQLGQTSLVELPFSQQTNGFLWQGNSLKTLRHQYMELTGKPPVPPKKAFGLWLSEYGFDNWHELDTKLASLSQAGFPVEGAVLDLQWYGGIEQRRMGSLQWDDKAFPDAAKRVKAYKQQGLGLIAIEQSYVDKQLADFGDWAKQGAFVLNAQNQPVELKSWWGNGSMLDWTNTRLAGQWHDKKRQPLIEQGLLGHWTDLGEPEDYQADSHYSRTIQGSNQHAQIHNLYNLLWSQSIWDGYQRHKLKQRPFSLARSGTAGSQRYGVAFWSGDLDSSLDSLMGHAQAQTNLSMAGVDYYGSDIGGFIRNGIDTAELNNLYSFWFANSSLFDIPLRPHVKNLENQYQSAPDQVGDVANNRHNYRRRLALTPYYYSLAHLANQQGDALISPMQYQIEGLPAAIQRDLSGSHKMIGPFLLSRNLYQLEDLQLPLTEARADINSPIYLPAGRWFDSVKQEFIDSQGGWAQAACYHNGKLQLPLLYRSGSIIPVYSDAQLDRASHQPFGILERLASEPELLKQVNFILVPDQQSSSFSLFEDDGQSTDYLHNQLARTRVEQQLQGQSLNIRIDASQGRLVLLPKQRLFVLDIKLAQRPTKVKLSLNQQPLSELAANAPAEQAGYKFTAQGLIVQTGLQATNQAKQLQLSW